MVGRSDFIVFCSRNESGGAWQTMRYAVNQSKPYINLYTQKKLQKVKKNHNFADVINKRHRRRQNYKQEAPFYLLHKNPV